MGSKWRMKYLLTSIYLLLLVLAVFILLPVTPSSTYIFASAIGLLWLATVPLTSGLVAQIFGLRYMATLTGIVFFSHQLGSFAGAWLGGLSLTRRALRHHLVDRCPPWRHRRTAFPDRRQARERAQTAGT